MDDRSSNQNQYHVPTSFSNPLLNIEPDTRVSDSLPRHLNRKPPLLSSSTVTTSTIASTVVTSSTTGIYGTAGNASNVKPSTLYHKSLNLLSNGVSPLLRKKPPIGQHSIVSTNSANTSDYYLPPSELVSCSPQVTSNGNNGRPIGGAGATKPLHLNSTSRLSAASANLNTALDRTQSNNNSRRQSEPNGAMLNAESMQANEFDRLQQRQEAMLESLNLDFETMLMNGGNPSSANNTNSGSVVATTGDRSVISGAHNSNTMHHHHHAHPHHMHHHHAHQIIMPHRQHLLQSNSGEYGRAGMKSVHHFGNTASSQAPSTMSTGSGNGTNGMTYKEHMYMMYDEASASNHHMLHGMQNASVNIPALHNQQHQLQQHQQQQQLQQHHQMQSSQPQSPNSHGQQQAPGNNNGHHMPTGLPPSGPGPGALAPASQIKSARNDENIYEEVDFLSLSSLRAQYADTLSLQSWKKKSTNSGKRGLGAAASSSFTRWFSTRKKGSSGGSCGALNSSISQADLHSPQMIASMVDGGPVYGEANLVSRRARAPICLPELTSGMQLTSQQLKRRMIVGSIVESENSYIASLQRLIHDFKKPLEQASPALLSANKINVIFYRLEQILQCHAIFSIALNLCVQQWDEREQIGEVFVSSFGRGMVLDLYSEFINNFTHAMETVRKASKAKNAFAQFLQQRAATSPDRLSFFGLMVKPVQRFPQFILLLDDLLKHTPADHPDRLCLQLALTQLESLADRLNERKRDSERHFAVRQLLKHYLSSSTTSSCSRYLLRMDDVLMLQLDSTSGLVTKSKCRKLYLLNDMLVCVSLPSNRLKFAVGLTDVDVLDDVAPATNSLLASSALRATKAESSSTPGSPQNCSVQRMYCELNGLLQDLETLSRIGNLIRSLRFQYSGLSPALPEQIAADIRAELRRKDAQISLIDRSCLQLRVRAKNYKELLVVQMSEPEVKRDWLTDVRLAKLALDRDNNPAWNIASEVGCPLPNQMTIGHHSSASGNPPPPFSGICQQRVPLFVKSLAIFATTDCSQLTCALFYQLPLPAALANTPAALLGAAGAASCGVLWICNVNQSGSQLGALATNGDDVHLIHSYELCESHVTCLEHVHAYSVWIGLRQGRVIVIDGTSPSEWRQLAALEVAGEVVCMKHVRQHVFVGLRTGVVTVFDIQDYDEPIIITLSQQPVTCILAVHDEVFACSGDKIWVINAQCQVCRSYSLCSSTSSSSSSSPIRSTSLEMDAAIESNLSAANAVTSAAGNVSPNEHSSGMISSDPPRPALLAHCGIGLWVSLIDSPIVKLYHTETFKHLQDINVASNVKRVLQEPSDVPIVVTSMLATRGLLWIGTSVGFVLTLSLPRLQGVPLVSGCLNVSLHRHLGPVSILLSLTPAAHANSVGAGRNGGRASASAVGASGHDGNTNGLAGETLESKGTDVESIYGLYADLMKVDDYMGTETARSSASTASTAIVSNVSAPSAASTLASNAVAGSAMQAGVAGAPSGANSTTAGRIAWELSNMALSDDSTSESASSGRIYQDGSRTAAAGPVSTGNGANPHSPVDAHGHDPKNGKTDDRSIYEARRAMSSANGFHSMHQPTSANSNTPSHLAGNGNVSSTTPFTNSASATNLRSQSVNSNGAGAAGGSSIYESSGVANVPLGLANPAPTATAANLKTALLITGGNGFKRGSANKPYSSQHAHCIIWEYKL